MLTALHLKSKGKKWLIIIIVLNLPRKLNNHETETNINELFYGQTVVPLGLLTTIHVGLTVVNNCDWKPYIAKFLRMYHI